MSNHGQMTSIPPSHTDGWMDVSCLMSKAEITVVSVVVEPRLVLVVLSGAFRRLLDSVQRSSPVSMWSSF